MEGKIIVITSGKGGVGKTTTTAALGAAIALEGKRVAVVDMDIGLRNLDVVMGLENRVVFTIIDLIKGHCMIHQAAIKDRRIENLFLIPASQSDNKNSITPEEMTKLCHQLRKEFDIILIDCPAGIEQGFENSVIAADEAVVVCVPEVSAIRDADRIVGLLYARSITPKLIINRIVPELVNTKDMLSHKDVLDILSIELLGLVCTDNFIITSTNTGTPVVLNRASEAGQAFHRIALRILGNTDIPIVDPLEQPKSIWGKIGSKIGLKRQNRA